MQQCSWHGLYLGLQRGLMWSDAIRFLKLQTEAMQGRKLDHLKVIYWSSSKPHFSSVLLQWPLRQIFRKQAGEKRTKETRTHKQWNEKSRRTLETASSDKLMQTVGEIRLTGLTGHRWKKIRVGQQIRKSGKQDKHGKQKQVGHATYLIFSEHEILLKCSQEKTRTKIHNKTWQLYLLMLY